MLGSPGGQRELQSCRLWLWGICWRNKILQTHFLCISEFAHTEIHLLSVLSLVCGLYPKPTWNVDKNTLIESCIRKIGLSWMSPSFTFHLPSSISRNHFDNSQMKGSLLVFSMLDQGWMLVAEVARLYRCVLFEVRTLALLWITFVFWLGVRMISRPMQSESRGLRGFWSIDFGVKNSMRSASFQKVWLLLSTHVSIVGHGIYLNKLSTNIVFIVNSHRVYSKCFFPRARRRIWAPSFFLYCTGVDLALGRCWSLWCWSHS